MKLSMTQTQFQTFYQLIKSVVAGDKPAEMEEKIWHVLMIRIYERLYKMDLKVKDKYNIKLMEEEAMAFYLWFETHPYPITSHAGNLINATRNLINQKFA